MRHGTDSFCREQVGMRLAKLGVSPVAAGLGVEFDARTGGPPASCQVDHLISVDRVRRVSVRPAAVVACVCTARDCGDEGRDKRDHAKGTARNGNGNWWCPFANSEVVPESV